jgi:hypothetical protein
MYTQKRVAQKENHCQSQVGFRSDLIMIRSERVL